VRDFRQGFFSFSVQQNSDNGELVRSFYKDLLPRREAKMGETNLRRIVVRSMRLSAMLLPVVRIVLVACASEDEI
jgi:hypothetical protein